MASSEKHLFHREFRKKNNINLAFEKVKNIDRDSLLVFKDKNANNTQVPLVTTFNPDLKHLHHVHTVIGKHWVWTTSYPTDIKTL